jgi:hypothetical protein
MVHESPVVIMKFWEEEGEEEEEDVKFVLGSWAMVLLVGLCVGLSLLLFVLLVDLCLSFTLNRLLHEIQRRNWSQQSQMVAATEEKVQKEFAKLDEYKIQHHLLIKDEHISVSQSPPP